MHSKIAGFIAAASLAFAGAPAAGQALNDEQIAHIAHTAGSLDIAVAKQALSKLGNATVREFASTMVRDHEAVNARALELVKALKVTPEDNSTSQALAKTAHDAQKRLDALNGAAFDRAYVEHEIAFHKTVNAALQSTLIPSAQNRQLRELLETGLALFREHQAHAEHLAASLK